MTASERIVDCLRGIDGHDLVELDVEIAEVEANLKTLKALREAICAVQVFATTLPAASSVDTPSIPAFPPPKPRSGNPRGIKRLPESRTPPPPVVEGNGKQIGIAQYLANNGPTRDNRLAGECGVAFHELPDLIEHPWFEIDKGIVSVTALGHQNAFAKVDAE